MKGLFLFALGCSFLPGALVIVWLTKKILDWVFDEPAETREKASNSAFFDCMEDLSNMETDTANIEAVNAVEVQNTLTARFKTSVIVDVLEYGTDSVKVRFSNGEVANVPTETIEITFDLEETI